MFLHWQRVMQVTTWAGENQHRFTEICKYNSFHQLMSNNTFAENIVLYQHLFYLRSPGQYLLTETAKTWNSHNTENFSQSCCGYKHQMFLPSCWTPQQCWREDFQNRTCLPPRFYFEVGLSWFRRCGHPKAVSSEKRRWLHNCNSDHPPCIFCRHLPKNYLMDRSRSLQFQTNVSTNWEYSKPR